MRIFCGTADGRTGSFPMHWSDEALVLGARRHGETSIILELMTRAHGRHLGLVHGGRSKRMQPVLQPGNSVQATWRARLDENLGVYAVEAGELRAASYLASAIALYGVATMATLLRLVPERDPHPRLYDAAAVLADHLADAEVAPALFVRFEVALLSELGVGLDLASCAATGTTRDLIYVSPKTGRAVARDPGEPYKDRLLALPPFLRGMAEGNEPTAAEVEAGFALTSFFLRHHVFGPRGIGEPEERVRFVALATKRAG
jgi:DNA repair protein RecO (recombination protein O)